MHPSYYFRAHACILVFDVTRKVTYQHLEGWYKELRQYSAHVPAIVVANKIDINPEVTKKEFQFATKRNLVNMFASAADGTNVGALLVFIHFTHVSRPILTELVAALLLPRRAQQSKSFATPSKRQCTSRRIRAVRIL